jgi:DNA-binding NtrC family response regulator
MKTILIADDSEGKIMLMHGMLKRMKWEGEIVEAKTTEDAKKLIDEHDINCAFIDYYIPSENGPALIAYLKEKNPNAHVALVSSADKVDNFDEARRAGAEACICTSYEADEVERAFVDLLERWKK